MEAGIKLDRETMTITDIEIPDSCPEPRRELITSYVKLYNEVRGTKDFFQDYIKVTGDKQRRWELVVSGLLTIVRALYRGYDPFTVNQSWYRMPISEYLAPIPEHIRDRIIEAIPIFGIQLIHIADPNPAHFQPPKVRDPVALGVVELPAQRHTFLIAMWDLDKDLKFIEEGVETIPVIVGSSPIALDQMRRTVQQGTNPLIVASRNYTRAQRGSGSAWKATYGSGLGRAGGYK